MVSFTTVLFHHTHTHTHSCAHRQTFFLSLYLSFYFKMKIKMKQIKWFVYAFSLLTFNLLVEGVFFVKHTHICIYCVWLESNFYTIVREPHTQYRSVRVWCHFNASVKNIRMHIYKLYVMTPDNLIFQVNATQCKCLGTKAKRCNLK